MNRTVIHIPSFQGAYKTGLIFSMIEGLKGGESFKLICDQAPEELELLLGEAKISQLYWQVAQVDGKRWEMVIIKGAEEESCCGMCGGESKSKRKI